MFNDKGPTMFINSVNTEVDDLHSQKVFDSRTKVNLKQNLESRNKENLESVKLEFLETRKLNNIIEMYNKNRPVLCNIIVGEAEVVGIPYKKEDNKLFVSISEDKSEVIKIDEISEIIIIKF